MNVVTNIITRMVYQIYRCLFYSHKMYIFYLRDQLVEAMVPLPCSQRSMYIVRVIDLLFLFKGSHIRLVSFAFHSLQSQLIQFLFISI